MTTGNVITDYEVAGAAVSSIDTGAVLAGDTDGWYTVIVRHVYDTSTSTLELTFNADTTAANYGYRGITANNTTVANTNSTAAKVRLGAVASGTTTALSVLTLYAKQGAVRLMNGFNICNINGTTVTQLEAIGSVWNNTNTQITNMVFTPSAGKIGVGGRVIILKGNALAVGAGPGTTGAWKRVGSTVLGSAAGSYTFTGLTGNTAILYYGSVQIKAENSAGEANCLGYLNGDTGANYGMQTLFAGNTTVSAGRFTGRSNFTCAISLFDANEYNSFNFLLFAKSGFVRPMIIQIVNEIAGTTIDYAGVYGHSWNNTADELTSIGFSANKGNGYAAGSQFDLYALYTS